MTPRTLRTSAASALLASVALMMGLWAADLSQQQPSLLPGAETESPPIAHTLGPLSAYEAVSGRPLFTPTRRPAPIQAAADPQQDTAPVVALIAIAIGPGRKAAILKLKSGGTAVLMAGESIDGWVLADISASGVVLRNGASQAEQSFPAPTAQQP
jgi:hypothetical protein